MKYSFCLLLLLFVCRCLASTGPIIDMHMHAYPADIFGEPPKQIPFTDYVAPVTTKEIREQSIAEMKKHNIVKAVLSGPLEQVNVWLESEPELFIGSPNPPRMSKNLNINELRQRYERGQLGAMAEVTSQYAGMTPADPQVRPYVKIAEDFDVPFGIHVGLSGRGVQNEHPDFRIANGRPLLLEPLILQHPNLRLYVMHSGWPFLDEMKAILWQYPHVYCEISPLGWFIPRKEFHDYLKQLIDAGFGKQIMFGTDQMIWPKAIKDSIEGIETAAFLTEEQKRDIFYNNAARFLRLSEEEIHRHHASVKK